MLKPFWQRRWDVCMGFRTSLVLLARFAPIGVLLGIKKNFFVPKMWLQMLANTVYPVCQTIAVAFIRTESCFTCKYHGLPLLVVCCFNLRDLPGLCTIGFHWKKKKIEGLKGRFKVVLMGILLWIQSLNLDVPSSLRWMGVAALDSADPRQPWVSLSLRSVLRPSSAHWTREWCQGFWLFQDLLVWPC